VNKKGYVYSHKRIFAPFCFNNMKTCSRCGLIKKESSFYKDKRNKDGLRYCCIDCYKKYESTDEFKELRRVYRKTDKYKEQKSKYQKKKILTDPTFRLSHNISKAICGAIRHKLNSSSFIKKKI